MLAGITPEEYAEQAKEFAKKNMAKMSDEAKKKQKEGTSTIKTNFMHWTGWDSVNNRYYSTDRVPNGRSGPTATGGKWFMKESWQLLKKVVPNNHITVNDDGTYTVKAKVTVEAKSAPSVMKYLRQAGEEGHKYYDPETDTIRTTVDHVLVPNTIQKVKISLYSESDVNELSKEDPRTKKLRIRNTKPMQLEDASFELYIKTFSRKTGDDSVATVFQDEFSICAKKITLDESEEVYATEARMYDAVFPKDTTFLYDIRDVLKGTATIPNKCYIYTSTYGQVEPDSYKLIRNTEFITDRQDVLFAYNTDQYETKPQARFTCWDIYPQEQKSYMIQFTAYEEVCKDTGLDTLDFDTWADIMQSHLFTGHFLCDYNEKKTLAIPSNSPGAVAERERLEGNFVKHGTYVFTAKHLAVDWEETLKAQAIQITKDAFINTFKQANKELPSSEKKFKVATVDGVDELYFESVLPYSNPIHNDGMYSKVINFGSGTRPTFSCSDATPILNHENATFWALTGVKADEAEKWSTPEEGSQVFQKQLDEQQVKYQLFVIQDITGEDQKR